MRVRKSKGTGDWDPQAPPGLVGEFLLKMSQESLAVKAVPDGSREDTSTANATITEALSTTTSKACGRRMCELLEDHLVRYGQVDVQEVSTILQPDMQKMILSGFVKVEGEIGFCYITREIEVDRDSTPFFSITPEVWAKKLLGHLKCSPDQKIIISNMSLVSKDT